MILTNDVDFITLYLYRWEFEFAEFPYVYRWKKYLPEFYQRLCRILRLGTAMNSLLIEFENGHQMVTSRNAIRRRTELIPFHDQGRITNLSTPQ